MNDSKSTNGGHSRQWKLEGWRADIAETIGEEQHCSDRAFWKSLCGDALEKLRAAGLLRTPAENRDDVFNIKRSDTLATRVEQLQADNDRLKKLLQQICKKAEFVGDHKLVKQIDRVLKGE